MKTTWFYNERTYPFDISEVTCMERVTRALEALRTVTAGQPGKEAPPYVALAEHCESIMAFFTTVFGKDAAAEICGGLKSGEKYTAAFFSFIFFVREQAAEIQHMIDAAGEKYRVTAQAMGVVV